MKTTKIVLAAVLALSTSLAFAQPGSGRAAGGQPTSSGTTSSTSGGGAAGGGGGGGP